MSRKNVLLKYAIFSAADMSQATLTSTIVDIRYMDNVAIQLNFTGTPTGTFDVQGSVDHNVSDPSETVSAAGSWVSLTLTPAPVASGAASSVLLDLNQLSFPFIRVVYTKTGSTGTLDGYIFGKAI